MSVKKRVIELIIKSSDISNEVKAKAVSQINNSSSIIDWVMNDSNIQLVKIAIKSSRSN